jgi:hypothetical protein
MTTAAIRTKLHKYIDEADEETLEVIYHLLESSRQNSSSLLTKSQQEEVITRSKLYKSGNIKGYSISEARNIISHRLTKPAL